VIRRAAALVSLAAIVSFGALGSSSAVASTGPSTAVIVTASSVADAHFAVAAAGGHVDQDLPIVNGVAAHVASDNVALLDNMAGVTVSPDIAMHATSTSFSASSADTQISAMDPGGDYSADAGRGISVALLDTGVADTPDLNGSRLVRSPDFSGENDGIDHYGHGTFMAGLIAGDGTASANDAHPHTGVAPAARIVSVKVAGADGSTTMSRVITGIGWVITHRDQYGIAVLNLSFGINTPMPYHADALDAAAEAAWASGIVVVASAGNQGSGSVTTPGDDPYIITVGAADTASTTTTADDTVPAWSGREDFHGYTKPDVVAPGVSVVSLRAPGSTIDVQHPEGRLGAAYFRGTGTSMSTAMTCGAAAVLLSHHPGATPDDIKGALVDTGAPLASGALEVDLSRADRATARSDWWQHYKVAFDGLGSLKLKDAMPWAATRWTSDNWDATRWTATRWTGIWDATRWTATRWTASRWTDETWAASRWTSEAFTASRWTSTRWTSDAWPSQSWG
jgi:serine protease AprX